MTEAKREVDGFRSQFEGFERLQGGNGASWVSPVRRRAFSRFAELGFPSTREEEWRHTNVSPLKRLSFQHALLQEGRAVEAGELVPFRLGDGDWDEIVFVDGRFAAPVSRMGSLPEGVRIKGLGDALIRDRGLVEPHLARYIDHEARAFAALNTAFLADGAFIHVPSNVILDRPIHMLFLSTGGPDAVVSQPRNLVIVGSNSEVTLVESYYSLEDGPHFTNAVTEIVVGENGGVTHYKLQDESEKSFHVATVQAHQRTGSRLLTTSLSFGGAITRNDIRSVLAGEGIDCRLHGLYLARGVQLVDHHTYIDHAEPRCESHELYKGILNGSSRGVFRGKIIVRPDAQKTDAKQSNQSLLLSDEAVMNTKPQLEIYADDVKCTHGATVGQLDEDSVFYLRSRGIDQEAARSILIYAFASEIVERIGLESLKKRIGDILVTRLPQGAMIREAL